MKDVEGGEGAVVARRGVVELGEIAVKIALAGSLEDVLQASVSSARALIGADFGVIHFVDRVQGSIDATYHDGYPVKDIPEGVVPRGLGVLGRIMRGGVVFTSDVTTEPDFAGFPPWHPRVGAMIGVPVRHGDQVHAILVLARGPGNGEFRDDDFLITSEVAGLAGVAVHMAVQREALEQSRRDAQSTASARRDLLVALSRDLREHVNTLMGMAELVMSSPLAPDQRSWVASIARNTEALLAHLDSTMEAQKVHASGNDMETIEFDPTVTARNAVDFFCGCAGREDGPDVRIELAEGLPPRVMGDPGRLRQVLGVLISNAVRFTEAGEVVLRVGSEPAVNGEVSMRFEVMDTGVGIPADRLERIFDPPCDEQAGRPMELPAHGLWMARSVVERMGGRMAVTSEPARGSTFAFTVRMRLPAVREPALHITLAGALSGLRVGVVQRELDDRTILLNMLEDMGAGVLSMASSSEAIERIIAADRSGQAFDLLLMDANIEGADGFDTTRILRGLPEGRTLPVILLSASGRRGDSYRSRSAGCDAYLTKPVRRSELHDAVMLVLGARAQGRQDLVTRYSICEAGATRARVLLVGHDSLNVVAASRILEARGHETTIVGDVQAAVDRLAVDGGYDIVLLNVPMMDEAMGSAASRLRASSDVHAGLPVLAIISRINADDRLACQRSGMSDYVSGPVDGAELSAVVDRWTRKDAARPAARKAPIAPVENVLDRDMVLARMGRDATLYADLARMAMTEIPAGIEKVMRLVSQGDGPGSILALRSLEETAQAVGAQQMAGVARDLERALDQGERDGSVLRRLEAAFDRLRPGLEKAAGR